jgi:iron complex transport system substrate-binding protein
MFSMRFTPLSLVLVLILVACAGPAALVPTATPATTPTPTGFTVTDALGRQVTFARPPQRIAVTGKALFMIADAIYLFPEASARVAAIGKTAQGKLDFIPIIDSNYSSKMILESGAGPEQIAAAQPDVVLLKSSVAESLGGPVEVLGVPVVYVDFETSEQYWRDLTTLGQLFQNEARAQQLIAFYQERTERVSKALAGLDEASKPRVLLLYYSDRDGTVAFNVPPLTWIQTSLVEMSGGQPVWEDAQLGQGWTTVNLEQVAAWDADQIYIVTYFSNVDDIVKTIKADPQWQALRAVKQGQIYAFPGDYYSWDQPDPRWILGLTWLAGRVNPDRFPDLNMEQEIRTFYKELYNLDDAAYREYIQPNLVGDLP